jgi:hypothetical protein
MRDNGWMVRRKRMEITMSGTRITRTTQGLGTQAFATQGLAALAAASLLAGCATTRVEGEWASPDFAGATLQGRTTMVSCSAPDDTLRRICEDQMLVALGQAGIDARRAPETATGPDPTPLGAARAAGAQALVRAALGSTGTVTSGIVPSIGIGIGGGGGRIGVGGGITMPIGGARAQEAFVASTSVVDVPSGNPIWSVRTGGGASSDPATQVEQLARATVDAMRKAGLL